MWPRQTGAAESKNSSQWNDAPLGPKLSDDPGSAQRDHDLHYRIYVATTANRV
jgi:hypothetical protein